MSAETERRNGSFLTPIQDAEKERSTKGGDPANIVTTPEEQEIIDTFVEKYLQNKGEKK